jgi:chromosomal replication initiator protein
MLEVANQFALDWINEHFRGLIADALAKTAGPALAFELRIADDVQQSEDPIANVVLPETLAAPPPEDRGVKPVDSRLGIDAHEALGPSSAQSFQTRETVGYPSRRRGNTTAGLTLSERYMFDNFVVGDSNQFAHAAALAVAEAGGSSRFNPLYIYGKVGLGKTHLAQAIGHHVLDLNPRAQVVYATSEKFTNDFITSLSAGSTAEFTQRYRTVDLLIVDDIQFFAGKESTQAQFFHTFNDLYQNGRRIVLTSDRPPREISGLEERLLSRFGWGLVTDIQPPDLETRIAILKKKTQNEQIDVPEGALVYIADQITSNIRDLEGSLIRLLAYASLFGRDVTLELTREVLQDTFKSNRRPITIERVQKAVAAHFSLPMEAMWTKKKTQEVATARQVAMYLARELTGSPLKTIGANFGGRDHSTVIHACTQVSTRTRQDPGFKQHVDQIVNNLYS